MTWLVLYLLVVSGSFWAMRWWVVREKATRVARVASRAVGECEEWRSRQCLSLRNDVIHDAPNRYRILVWDADSASDQVEGVLVPYFIAHGGTKRECEAQIGDFLVRMAMERGGMLTVELVEERFIVST